MIFRSPEGGTTNFVPPFLSAKMREKPQNQTRIFFN